MEGSFREVKGEKERGMKRLEADMEEIRSELDEVETEAKDLEVQLEGSKKGAASITSEIKDLRDQLRKKRQEYRKKSSTAQMSADVTRTSLMERVTRTQIQDQSLAEFGRLSRRLLRGRGS